MTLNRHFDLLSIVALIGFAIYDVPATAGRPEEYAGGTDMVDDRVQDGKECTQPEDTKFGESEAGLLQTNGNPWAKVSSSHVFQKPAGHGGQVPNQGRNSAKVQQHKARQDTCRYAKKDLKCPACQMSAPLDAAVQRRQHQSCSSGCSSACVGSENKEQCMQHCMQQCMQDIKKTCSSACVGDCNSKVHKSAITAHNDDELKDYKCDVYFTGGSSSHRFCTKWNGQKDEMLFHGDTCSFVSCKGNRHDQKHLQQCYENIGEGFWTSVTNLRREKRRWQNTVNKLKNRKDQVSQHEENKAQSHLFELIKELKAEEEVMPAVIFAWKNSIASVCTNYPRGCQIKSRQVSDLDLHKLSGEDALKAVEDRINYMWKNHDTMDGHKLRIITGQGHHSDDNLPVIKTAVEAMLQYDPCKFEYNFDKGSGHINEG